MRLSQLFSLCLCAFVVPLLSAAEPIAFSIHDAHSAPLVVQGRSKIAFSIHDHQDESAIKGAGISFSVNDAPMPDEKPEGDALKPDCTPARTLNRMLVIHPASVPQRVKVCDQFGCRVELRQVAPPIIADLKKLAPKWSCGDRECDHFKLVNADDPKNVELLKEIGVKRDELPLLVKETDLDKRKKAAGMSADDIAKLWNKWFVAPEPDEKAEAPKCLPSFGSDHHQWSWPGNIRDHLTDPRQAHHLPRAVVDSWTDDQCKKFHAWHHEVLSGKRAANGSRQAPVVNSLGPQSRYNQKADAFRSPLEQRALTIAHSIVRSPPPRMVAAANASDKSAKKKRSESFANGNPMNGTA